MAGIIPHNIGWSDYPVDQITNRTGVDLTASQLSYLFWEVKTLRFTAELTGLDGEGNPVSSSYTGLSGRGAQFGLDAPWLYADGQSFLTWSKGIATNYNPPLVTPNDGFRGYSMQYATNFHGLHNPPTSTGFAPGCTLFATDRSSGDGPSIFWRGGYVVRRREEPSKYFAPLGAFAYAHHDPDEMGEGGYDLGAAIIMPEVDPPESTTIIGAMQFTVKDSIFVFPFVTVPFIVPNYARTTACNGTLEVAEEF